MICRHKSRLTWHANALEYASAVDAGSLVQARVGFALVDVGFATEAFESGWAIAAVRSGHVNADSVVFARGP